MSCGHSLQNSTDTNELFLRIKIYFHFQILKKLKLKTLRSSRNVVFSQLNWGSVIMNIGRGHNGAELCSCHISLGYQRKSSLGFYFEKALCLKCSIYRISVDVLAKNTIDFSSNMAAARLARSTWTPLCLWVLWCLSSLPCMKDSWTRSMPRVLFLACGNRGNSSLFNRFMMEKDESLNNGPMSPSSA